MTVTTATSRIEYAGDGATTAFSVPFYFLANGDLKVYQAGALKTITTHYTVTGAGNPAGGTVTFVAAPGSSDDVVIYRDPAITQSTDYVENDPFPAESHETALDRLTMIAQRSRDLLTRAVRLPDSEADAASMTLPEKASRLSHVIGFDTLGNLTTYTAQAGTSLIDLAASTGSDLIGFIQSGTGAVLRTAQDKMREIVSVKDFGAVGDGVTDDTTAIQAAIDYIDSLAGGVLYFPAGTYYLASTLVPCNFLTVQGECAGIKTGSAPAGSFILCRGNAFTAPNIQKFNVKDIGFAATGTGVGNVYAYQQTLLTAYSERCYFENVVVWGNMAGAFLGNFILTTWKRCEFGYYDTPSGQFWPIYSKGDITGMQTNANLIEDCYILNSLGSYTIFFEAGSDITIRNCRFEGCDAVTTINFAGILVSTIEGCYFEDSNGASTTALIAYGNDSTNAQGCTSINFFGNYGSLSTNNTHLIAHAGASGSINAVGNRFEGITGGKNFIVSTNYGNNAPVAAYFGNSLGGLIEEGAIFTKGTFTPVVASFGGALTSYTATGQWRKLGRTVTLDIVINVTDNGTGSVLILVTGLPAAITPDTSYSSYYTASGLNRSTAKALSCEVISSGINVYRYDAAYPVATGEILVITASYTSTT